MKNLSVIHLFDVAGVPYDDIVIKDAVIDDLLIQNNQLYIINFKTVYVLAFTEEVELVAVIDQSYVQFWPLTQKWEPTKLFAHNSFPNTLFVQLKEGIVVISTQTVPIYLNIIKSMNEKYYGALSPNSFLIL